MRALYLDAFAGISGDMTVGALLALGLDFARLRDELAALPLTGYHLHVTERLVNGVRATKFDVEVEDHGAAHHEHRPFGHIRTLLETSRLRPAVREKALVIFTRLAEAEGRVHGVAAETVEFHEVGAIDSIVDIVATAIGLVALEVTRLSVSALPLGSGTVASQHGILPVPAPATVELLQGFAVRPGDGVGELVTPTGAAILAALATPGEPAPPLRIERVGYGAGTRTLADRPNVLRALLGTVAAPLASDEMVLLETNLDDMNPEWFDHVMEQLFAAGARDVWLAPILMKRNRPGTLLRVLGDPAERDVLAGIILRETTAIGVRYSTVQRLLLPRESITVDTEFGAVAVKIARAPDGTVNVAPEHEACRRLAAERGVPLKLVYQAALAAARK